MKVAYPRSPIGLETEPKLEPWSPGFKLSVASPHTGSAPYVCLASWFFYFSWWGMRKKKKLKWELKWSEEEKMKTFWGYQNVSILERPWQKNRTNWSQFPLADGQGGDNDTPPAKSCRPLGTTYINMFFERLYKQRPENRAMKRSLKVAAAWIWESRTQVQISPCICVSFVRKGKLLDLSGTQLLYP